VHVPLHDPGPILAWLGRVRRSGGTPHLKTFTSSAVRLCEAARAARADLRGVRLTVTGEPLTGARLAVMADTGAEVAPDYGSTESGQIGEPCVAPAAPDDLHLCDDLHAVVQPGDGGPGRGLPPRALLLTSLRTTAPLVLLNVSLGDEADLVARACGCPMDGYGFPRHLERVRSFEKLTSEGMTFLDADVSRILETVLPARFGGGPTHYQIVDEDDARGRPGLRLLVDPAVGAVDPAAVATAFLDALGAGSGADRIMAAVWRDAGLLRVERRAPYVTGSGKILHVHRRRD
jgi:hypothetical protein